MTEIEKLIEEKKTFKKLFKYCWEESKELIKENETLKKQIENLKEENEILEDKLNIVQVTGEADFREL
ncbi:hypothetical protein LCGC14_1154530 [marine sediment metagenome]|uniref:Uncharacterized protein n=1 Tax=marine sediment metagenome TaxID=412755 RepID=A0A0F9LUJ1_9ZZZZ